MKIPKQIFQTHKNRVIARDCVNSWLSQAGYKHYFYDDIQLDKFMHDYSKEAHRAFNDVWAPAVKVDLWRYIILYEKGGIYADADIRLVKNLQDFIPIDEELIVVNDDLKPCRDIFQGFIACKKGHPALKEAVDLTISNILHRRYEKCGDTKHNVFMISGPSMFGGIIKKYPCTYLLHQVAKVDKILSRSGETLMLAQCLKGFSVDHYGNLKYIYKDNPFVPLQTGFSP